MYIVVYTLMLLITLCVGLRIYKVAFNPITVWASLWCLIGMLSNIAFYDYYPPSNFILVYAMFEHIYLFQCYQHIF